MNIQKKLDEFFNDSHAVQVDSGAWYYHHSPVETELSRLYKHTTDLQAELRLKNDYIVELLNGQAIRDLEQKALGCFECCNEGGEDKEATYMFLREINNFGVNYSKQAKQLREQAKGGDLVEDDQ